MRSRHERPHCNNTAGLPVRPLADQAAAVQSARAAFTAPATVEEVAAWFLNSKKNADRIEELLDVLVFLGKARELKNACFLAA